MLWNAVRVKNTKYTKRKTFLQKKKLFHKKKNFCPKRETFLQKENLFYKNKHFLAEIKTFGQKEKYFRTRYFRRFSALLTEEIAWPCWLGAIVFNASDAATHCERTTTADCQVSFRQISHRKNRKSLSGAQSLYITSSGIGLVQGEFFGIGFGKTGFWAIKYTKFVLQIAPPMQPWVASSCFENSPTTIIVISSSQWLDCCSYSITICIE